MIARQFFSDPGSAEPAQSSELGDADQAFGEGDSPDLGSFDV